MICVIDGLVNSSDSRLLLFLLGPFVLLNDFAVQHISLRPPSPPPYISSQNPSPASPASSSPSAPSHTRDPVTNAPARHAKTKAEEAGLRFSAADTGRNDEGEAQNPFLCLPWRCFEPDGVAERSPRNGQGWRRVPRRQRNSNGKEMEMVFEFEACSIYRAPWYSPLAPSSPSYKDPAESHGVRAPCYPCFTSLAYSGTCCSRLSGSG